MVETMFNTDRLSVPGSRLLQAKKQRKDTPNSPHKRGG